MTRKFRTANYEETLKLSVTLGEALPPNHLARFVVDLISQLDLSAVYARYAPVGGEPFAPEILLGLLFYGYATGVFSSRKIEKATYEHIPFRFIAGGLHPDHDTIAHFRKTFLDEIQDLFVQILLLAQATGVLKLENISLDGSKLHADASKSKAVSYKRLMEIDTQLRKEVGELFELGEQADQGDQPLPEGLVIQDEIAIREERLANLAKAKAVLEARAKERYEAEKAEYEAKLREREKKASRHHRKPKGRPPQPPTPGPHDNDQYNFTDPDSRITPAPTAEQVRVKNSTDEGFDQHYNVQAAVDQGSLLIVASYFPTTPMTNAKPSRRWRPSPRKWAPPPRPPWTTVTSARRLFRPVSNAVLSPTSRPAERHTIRVGRPSLTNGLNPQPWTPVRRSKWLTNFRPRLVKRSIACGNARWNP